MVWKRLVHFGFRLLYNELAWTYDFVSWLVSLGAWRFWQQAALPYVQGVDVLEIGHGPGHMLLALQRAGFRAVGLDLSPNMGRLAARRLANVGTAVPLIRGDVFHLPLAAGVFDTVLATFPTDYIAQPETLAAANRVLRDDGRFLIIPEAHLTGCAPWIRFIEWLYAVTGQRAGPFTVAEPEWSDYPAWQMMAARFSTAGFQLEITQIRLRRSAVTILIAHKDVGSSQTGLIQSINAE